MISVILYKTNVYIMDMDENISQATSGTIICNNKSLEFLEQNGKYAYSEFFREGDWPDKYYDDDELCSMYQGIRLMMISGGWCENFSDLIQTISHHSIFKVIDKVIEKEETLLSFVIRMKSGEGIRRGRGRFQSLTLTEEVNEEVNEEINEEDGNNPWEYDPEVDVDGDNYWD